MKIKQTMTFPTECPNVSKPCTEEEANRNYDKKKICSYGNGRVDCQRKLEDPSMCICDLSTNKNPDCAIGKLHQKMIEFLVAYK